MTEIVEHNDVDISPLFTWSKEFEIIDNGISTPVFIRLLGDADINIARVAALRSSAVLRKKLKDINSDERLAYIKDIDDLTMDSLIAVVTAFSMRSLSDNVVKNLKIKPPKLPRSDAKTSVHEKYQAEVDSYPERRQTEIRSGLEKEVDKLRKLLEKEDKVVVYNKYVNSMIDEICEQELMRVFKAWSAYLGSYKDGSLSERLFLSFDEFNNLQSYLKEQFISEYSKLELNGNDLKKLQRVTQ